MERYYPQNDLTNLSCSACKQSIWTDIEKVEKGWFAICKCGNSEEINDR